MYFKLSRSTLDITFSVCYSQLFWDYKNIFQPMDFALLTPVTITFFCSSFTICPVWYYFCFMIRELQNPQRDFSCHFVTVLSLSMHVHRNKNSLLWALDERGQESCEREFIFISTNTVLSSSLVWLGLRMSPRIRAPWCFRFCGSACVVSLHICHRSSLSLSSLFLLKCCWSRGEKIAGTLWSVCTPCTTLHT